MGSVSLGWSKKTSLYESSVLSLENLGGHSEASRVGGWAGVKARVRVGGRLEGPGAAAGNGVLRVRWEPPESVSSGRTYSGLHFIKISLAAVCKWTFVQGIDVKQGDAVGCHCFHIMTTYSGLVTRDRHNLEAISIGLEGWKGMRGLKDGAAVLDVSHCMVDEGIDELGEDRDGTRFKGVLDLWFLLGPW